MANMSDASNAEFYPVSIGQVLHHRYRLLQRLGSGRYSAVYLARDQKESSYKAIKILRPDCYNGKHDLFELEIPRHLRRANPDHPGYQHITILLDDFIHIGQSGNRHVCLVMEPMAEDMKGFSFFFDGAKIPNLIMKRITRQLLSALEYAHASGVIHSDIKQDNIMVKVRDPSIIDRYLKDSLSNPAANLGEYNFDDISELIHTEVVLCDWGSSSWVRKHLTEMIQPRLLRAPEVILGAPWGKEVDIWNLGALLPELLDTVQMFSGKATVTGGVYHIKHHIEEIDALFGPFPSEMLANGNSKLVERIFDNDCKIRDCTKRPPAMLERWIQCLDGPEKTNFLSLIRSMLIIDPKERKTALALQRASWLTTG